MDMDGVLLIKTELKSFRDEILHSLQDCLDSLRKEHERALREQSDQLQAFLHRQPQTKEPDGTSAGEPVEKEIDVALTDALVHQFNNQNCQMEKAFETTTSAKVSHSSLSSTQRFFNSQNEAIKGRDSKRFDGAFGDLMQHHDTNELSTSIRPNLYNKTGIWQGIVQNDVFQSITFAIILANAVYLGVDLELNHQDFLWFAEWPFIVTENIFCAFYVLEWLIRFQAFRRKLDCVRDFWFKFDTLLMALTVMETWFTGLLFLMTESSQSLPTAPLRLLRLLRLGRLVRLVRGAHELITIARGLMIAARACIATMAMIFLTNFAGSIFIYTIVKHERRLDSWFNSLSETMWTLFLDGTLMCNTGDVYNAFRGCDGIAVWGIGLMIFFCHQCVANFMLLNLLTGILVQVVTTVATEENDRAAMKILQKTILKSLISHDCDLSGNISGEELMTILRSREAGRALQSLGIDLDYVLEFAEIMLIHEGFEVPIPRMMHMILSCRGDQPATVSSTAFAARLTHAYLETILDGLRVPPDQRPSARTSARPSVNFSEDPDSDSALFAPSFGQQSI